MSYAARAELLIREAEKGSASHLDRLCHEWPRNPSQSNRALGVVLRHFEAERNAMWDLTTGRQSITDAAHSVRLIRACLAAMDGALDYIWEATGEVKEPMSALLIPHLDDFVTWLHFFARKSLMIFPGAPSYFGASNAMDRIYTVIKAGDVYLEKDPACLQRIVGFVLWGWTQDVEVPVGEEETADEYEERVLSRMEVIVHCVQRPVIKGVLLESISLRDNRYHKRLVQAFFRRCQDWTAAHQHLYLEDPSKVEHIVFRMMVEVAVVLSANGGCFRYLRKFRFPVFVMDLAMKFCNGKAAGPSSQFTLPVEISAFFLDRLIGTTYDAIHLVPGLLDAGLLQVLFDDLFSHLQGQKSAYQWEDVGDESTPLEMLSRNSHPLVIGALRRAVGSLPQTTLDTLRNDAVAVRHLRCLLELLELYEEAFERYPEDDIQLCDSLEHRSATLPQVPASKCKECSWCHATTYCSSICQENDWVSFHRYECKSNRARRIELELQGAWISHQIRAFNLRVLENLLRSNLRTTPVPSEPRDDGIEPSVLVADIRHAPFTVSLESIDGVLQGSSVFRTKLFDDSRSQALAEGCRGDPSVRLVCSVYMMGRYFVATMGKFLLPSDTGEGDDAEPDGLVLLNGFSRVLDYARFDHFESDFNLRTPLVT